MSEKLSILKIYADEKGETHFGSIEVELENSGKIGFLSKLQQGTGIIFRKTPSDYDYEWHCAPRKQYIINLDASVEVEVSDGEKRVIPAGEIFLVEDVKGKGHQSKSVDNKERNSIFIPIN